VQDPWRSEASVIDGAGSGARTSRWPDTVIVSRKCFHRQTKLLKMSLRREKASVPFDVIIEKVITVCLGTRTGIMGELCTCDIGRQNRRDKNDFITVFIC
jgi:hypothetical protein